MFAPFVSLPAKPPELHIPDGMLSLIISIVCWAVTIILLIIAINRTQSQLAERQIPLMGIMAAFIFAAQMINFPIPGGTSGHLLGGVLAAVVLGPWAGMLVMASVIGLQAILFQDGGLLVMGANILNMGILTSLIGYGLYRAVVGRPLVVRLIVIGIAAWLSVMAGALATALQVWLSGAATLTIVVPTMLGVHAVIGIGEALITVAAITFIERTRPDLLAQTNTTAQGGSGWIIVGGVLSAAVVLLSPFASGDPDGLERVAEDLGFLDRAQDALYQTFPDYTVPGIEGDISTILSGLIGIALVGFLAYIIARTLRSRSS